MTSNIPFSDFNEVRSANQSQSKERWHGFEEILQRLHAEGILIHPDQLAEFMLAHGLPVDLRYVPEHLQTKAAKINSNYQGDMVRLIEEPDEKYNQFPWLLENKLILEKEFSRQNRREAQAAPTEVRSSSGRFKPTTN